MTSSTSLPARPSLESLRKQAKGLARNIAAGASSHNFSFVMIRCLGMAVHLQPSHGKASSRPEPQALDLQVTLKVCTSLGSASYETSAEAFTVR
jgi:hypothetical protein